jgi:hypothetical protein
MGTLLRFVSWLLKKVTFGVLLAVLGLASAGLWVFLRDRVDFDLRRSDLVRALTGETARLRAALADVEARMAELRHQITAQEQRAQQADKVAGDLLDLNSGLNRMTADSAQVRENDTRIVAMRQMAEDARREAAALKEKLTRTQWEKDGLEIALGRVEQQRLQVEAEKSKVVHYAREAWERYGRHVLLVVAIYFLGPPLWRIFAYTVIAPGLSRRPPVRLGSAAALPEVRTSRAALAMTLAPGETLWVKEKYLQASDEGLAKRTRWLLDWRMPLACVATGLVELIEMRHRGESGDQAVTFSSQDNPHLELALVTLPAGSGLILRPRFIAGVIAPAGGRLGLRRHWRIFTLQSWVTGQFRYFEFVGPCSLLLAGSRGVRAEILAAAAGAPEPARRVNRDALIGFTPGLGYRPVRAETFWAYLRGRNPLFDDRFEGAGVFLSQENTARDPSEKEPGLGARLWEAWLKCFGL